MNISETNIERLTKICLSLNGEKLVKFFNDNILKELDTIVLSQDKSHILRSIEELKNKAKELNALPTINDFEKEFKKVFNTDKLKMQLLDVENGSLERELQKHYIQINDIASKYPHIKESELFKMVSFPSFVKIRQIHSTLTDPPETPDGLKQNDNGKYILDVDAILTLLVKSTVFTETVPETSYVNNLQKICEGFTHFNFLPRDVPDTIADKIGHTQSKGGRFNSSQYKYYVRVDGFLRHRRNN